jgi:cell division protein ZipA
MTSEERAQLTSRLNLRERVPMLMDSVEVAPEPEDSSEAPSAAPVPTVEQQSLDFDAPAPERAAYEPEPLPEPEEPRDAADEVTFDRGREDDEPAMGDWHFSAQDDYEPLFGDADTNEAGPASESGHSDNDSAMATDWDAVDAVPETEDSGAPSNHPVSESEPGSEPQTAAPARPEQLSDEEQFEQDTRPVEELVIMHVMAKGDQDIAGSDLLELLLRAGLRYGPMDIFHYRNPQGQLEFSLANSVQPGTLDPDTMEQMTTPGVTLFMQLPQHADMMSSFDHLYEMAVFLARQLDAVVLDEEHSTVTAQRVEHYRERLRNFARTQLIQAHE